MRAARPADETTDLAGLAGCDLVIEAIVEEPEAKRGLFAELSAIAPEAILATNTSALSITEIAAAAAAPERVVRTELTAEEVYEDAYAFAAALGKEPIRCHDTPGFDIPVHASEALWEARREPRMAPPARLQAMEKAGLLGRKSGRGFYTYD